MKSELAEQIDKLVRDHLAQVQTEAEQAVRRAFAAKATVKTKAQVQPKTRSTKRSPSRRRDPSQVAELVQRLHARIVAEPGESMAVHARHLGADVIELHYPMTLLRRAGRLRTTGARNNTRYYPTPGS